MGVEKKEARVAASAQRIERNKSNSTRLYNELFCLSLRWFKMWWDKIKRNQTTAVSYTYLNSESLFTRWKLERRLMREKGRGKGEGINIRTTDVLECVSRVKCRLCREDAKRCKEERAIAACSAVSAAVTSSRVGLAGSRRIRVNTRDHNRDWPWL